MYKIAIRILKKAQQKYWGTEGAGLLFVCQEDNTCLLLKRSHSVQEPGTWGIAGGAIEISNDEDNSGPESSMDGAKREAIEELGSLPNFGELLDTVVYQDGSFKYTTYVFSVSKKEKQEWTPKITLNWENTEIRWFPLNALPSNLHFGTKYIKQNIKNESIDFEDPINVFDWLRKEFNILKPYLSEDNYKSVISIASTLGINKEKESQHKDFLNIRSALRECLKELIGKSEFEAAVIIRSIIKKVEISYDHLTEGYKKRHDSYIDLKNLPNSKISEHSGEFYHGTNFAEAASVLKSKTFVKASSFSRLSLTTDITSAMKFGDVIFVFDAKRLQRKGAKKIRYMNMNMNDRLMEEYKKNTGKYPNEDDEKKPIITDVYLEEKEWFVRLPFTFNDSDLLKLIIVKSDYFDANKAKEKLESITSAPVQIISKPSFSTSPLKTSKNQEIESVEIVHNVFGTLVVASQFIQESNKLLNSLKKRYAEKFSVTNPEDANFYVKRTNVYYFVTLVSKILQDMREGSRGANSLSDGLKFTGKINELKHVFDSTRYEKFETDESDTLKLKNALKDIIEYEESFKKSIQKSFLSNNDDIDRFIKEYLYGNHWSDVKMSHLKDFRDVVTSYLDNNPEKVSEIYSDPSVDKYRKKQFLEYFIEKTNNLRSWPLEILRLTPLSVINNSNFQNLKNEDVENIFYQNENLKEFNFIEEIKNKFNGASDKKKDLLHLIEQIFYKDNPDKKPNTTIKASVATGL